MINLLARTAKANAKYMCQECNSMEFIQAHHNTPGDDNDLVVLCALCHSRRHPSIPIGLFTNKTHQPYWQNKSAGALGRELGIQPQTIILRAKRLKIQKGDLSIKDEQRLKERGKYGGQTRKLARNEQVRRYKQEHPELSWKEIGQAFGISGSRVWRICHDGRSSKCQ